MARRSWASTPTSRPSTPWCWARARSRCSTWPSAYSTFARRGRHVDPIFITKVEQVVDGAGQGARAGRRRRADQVLRSGDADQVNWILRQVVLGGTGTSANFGVPIAGKTGTTQDYRDAWFVGYTPKLTTAVWMGFPDPDENGEPVFMKDVRGRKVTGGSFPAQIWRTYMEQATAGRRPGHVRGRRRRSAARSSTPT